MPEGRYAQVVILAEDSNQARFVRRWLLKHVNVSDRAIRVSKCPKIGGGAGEQFVREQFVVERNNHRTAAARRGSLLIVVIDADVHEVEARRRQLAGVEIVPEGVFVFVPKRNIETWFQVLSGHNANEADDYKRQGAHDYEPAIREAAAAFLELIRTTQAPIPIPSLADGVREGRRIPREHIPAN